MVASVVILLISLWWFNQIKIPENFPPGPRIWFPFLNSLVAFLPDAFKEMKNGRLKYGDIFGFAFSNNLYVVVNEFELVKDVLSRLDKPPYEGIAYLRGRSHDGSIPGILQR